MKRVASPLSALALAAGVMGAGKGNSLGGKYAVSEPLLPLRQRRLCVWPVGQMASFLFGVFTKRAAMAWLCGRVTGMVTGLRPNGLARLWVAAAVSQLPLA